MPTLFPKTASHSRLAIADRRAIALAFEDVLNGTRMWRTWYVLGISELRQRYRRSMLGPFWVTLSMGIQAIVMGFVLSFLFNLEVGRFLPFLCISLVSWNYIANAVNEGANCFIANSAVILQVKRPLWTYVMLILWRNAIIYGHTIVIFVVAAVAYQIYPTERYLLIPAGLLLLIVNVGWMSLAAGIISARFRDVPLLVQSVFTMLVWLTPVYYDANQLPQRIRRIIDLNPLTHIIEVARAPFLNEIPPASAWFVAFAVAALGWAVTFALLVRARARVPYWL